MKGFFTNWKTTVPSLLFALANVVNILDADLISPGLLAVVNTAALTAVGIFSRDYNVTSEQSLPGGGPKRPS